MHRCTPQKWKVVMHRHKSQRAKNSWREKIAGQNKSGRKIAPKRWRRCLITTLPLVRGKLTSLLLRVLNHSLTNLILYMCNKRRILKHRWLWCQVVNTPTGPPAAVEDKIRLRQESKSYAKKHSNSTLEIFGICYMECTLDSEIGRSSNLTVILG